MLDGFLACWRGLRHLEQRGYLFIWANLFWVVLSLPLITAPAAWAALIRLSYVSYTTPTATITDFWEGFRENLLRGTVVAVLNIVIFGVSITNLWFYRDQMDLLFTVLRGLWLLALAVWVMIQFYLWPLLLEMKTPALTTGLRNAAVMILLNPLYTLGLWLGLTIIAAFSTIIPPVWLVVTVAVFAAIATGAVLDRLEAAGLRSKAKK